MTTEQTYGERPIATFGGWPVLIAMIPGFFAFAGLLFYLGSFETVTTYGTEPTFSFALLAILFAMGVGCTITIGVGFYSNPPLTVSVIGLAGRYHGVDSEQGLRWFYPWYGTASVSKRLANTSISSIRVNDKSGNPIDIGAVIVWKIEDAAKSSYLVEKHDTFLMNQAEVSLRMLASRAYYDRTEIEVQKDAPSSPDPEADAETLIENREEAGARAAAILKKLIGDIGIQIVSLNITHLSYAPEIAGVMLRRQAADAVISARRKIVHGAVEIVKEAMEKLPSLKKDDDRAGAIAANLLTVLVGEHGVTPVINVGDIRG